MEITLEQKFNTLESTLTKFRAEVDMKMSIVEQVLITKNEQLLVQIKLLQREQILHESVLSHWKNISDFAEKGFSLQFTEDTDIAAEADFATSEVDEVNNTNTLLGKRQCSKSALARRERSKRVKTRKRANVESDKEDGFGDNNLGHDLISTEITDDSKAYQHSENDQNDEAEAEVKSEVFINNFSEEAIVPEHNVTPAQTAEWQYLLSDESSETALCKLCEEQGIQSIFPTKKRTGTLMSNVRTHLKSRHEIEILVENNEARRRESIEKYLEIGVQHCGFNVRNLVNQQFFQIIISTHSKLSPKRIKLLARAILQYQGVPATVDMVCTQLKNLGYGDDVIEVYRGATGKLVETRKRNSDRTTALQNELLKLGKIPDLTVTARTRTASRDGVEEKLAQRKSNGTPEIDGGTDGMEFD